MNNKERPIGIGTVVALGFIVLGILNLYASRHYHKTAITIVSWIAGYPVYFNWGDYSDYKSHSK